MNALMLNNDQNNSDIIQKNNNSQKFDKKHAKCHPNKNRFFDQNQKSKIECVKNIIQEKLSKDHKF